MTLPNLVLIMTDTQGADVVGAYRPELALRTPCLDALAAQGALCERAYTTSPLCTPARSGLFTGIYSQRSGAWTNSLPLGEGMRHVGQYFKGLGYRTAYIGKWHLDGHDYFGNGRCPDGFEDEYWYDGRRYLEELTPEQRKFWRTACTYEEFATVTPEFTWAGRCNQRARRFLESCRGGGKPFLLVLSYDEPHHPYTCPASYIEPFREWDYPVGPSWNDDLADKPEHYRRWRGGRTVAPTVRMPLYFGCNSFVDRMIGDAVELVDRNASRTDTWVFYTSDHGAMNDAHGLFNKGPACFDQITRIPLLVRGPSVPAGRRVATAVSHADILPTMLGLAGATAPAALDGGNVLPLLQGAEQPAREVVVEYHRYEIAHDGFMGYAPMRMLVGGGWKLALHERSGDELYHLTEDPHELRNRILDPECSAIRDAMHDRLLLWMDEHRDPWRGDSWRRRGWRDLEPLPYRALSRPNPPDGRQPTYLDYDTGEPTRGTAVHYAAKAK